jgi:hypothetical protein
MARASGELQRAVWMVFLRGHQIPSSALIPSPHSAFADSSGATASAYAPLRRDHRYRTAAKLPSEAGPELPSGGGEERIGRELAETKFHELNL